MSGRWVVAVLLATLAAPHAGCAAKKPAAVEAPPPAARPAPAYDLVVLLPDDDGTVGAASVWNPSGKTDLDTPRAAARITKLEAPSPAAVVTGDDIEQIFGETLSALPRPVERFTVYFRFESEELTPQSRAHLSGILQAVKERPAPEISVIGHTDTAGAAKANFQLGLSRANSVRKILIANGLDATGIEVTSFGEADPLIPTADGVLEARNRRVEITVR